MVQLLLLKAEYFEAYQNVPATCTHSVPPYNYLFVVICLLILARKICILFGLYVGIWPLDGFSLLLCLTHCCQASIFTSPCLSPASCLVNWEQLCSSTLIKHSDLCIKSKLSLPQMALFIVLI